MGIPAFTAEASLYRTRHHYAQAPYSGSYADPPIAPPAPAYLYPAWSANATVAPAGGFSVTAATSVTSVLSHGVVREGACPSGTHLKKVYSVYGGYGYTCVPNIPPPPPPTPCVEGMPGWENCPIAGWPGHSYCTNIDSDSANCGRCGNSCEAGGSGLCCGGTCVDITVENCGSCGLACHQPTNGSVACKLVMSQEPWPNAQLVYQCVVTCEPGYTQCGSDCANLANDPENCGSCGRGCPAPANAIATCTGGACAFSCAPGFTLCGDACVDTSTDSSNCGSCGNVCRGGASCKDGTCTCPPGLSYCSGACVPLTTTWNCGGCGITCQAGEGCCGGKCAALNTAENCGVCGTVCSGGKYCGTGNTCQCPAGETECGGTCMGSGYTCCGNAVPCPPGQSCCGSTCLPIGEPVCCQSGTATWGCPTGSTCGVEGLESCCPPGTSMSAGYGALSPWCCPYGQQGCGPQNCKPLGTVCCDVVQNGYCPAGQSCDIPNVCVTDPCLGCCGCSSSGQVCCANGVCAPTAADCPGFY
jgi:hypothetical protein